VVRDTGTGIGPATLMVAERADLVLGVTTADVASITDAYALCKVLQARGRKMPQVVVNPCGAATKRCARRGSWRRWQRSSSARKCG